MFELLKKNKLLWFLSIIVVLTTTVAVVHAGSDPVPNTFTSGTTASASEVNTNFTHFKDRAFDLSGNNIFYNTGFVGIGTSSPLDPLHIQADSGYDNIHLEEYSGGEDWQIGVDATGDLNFEDGGTTRVTFEDGGYVGIGTDNPAYPLHVVRNILSTAVYASSTDGTNTTQAYLAGSYDGLYGYTNRDSGYGTYSTSYGDYGRGVYGYAGGDYGYGVYGYAYGVDGRGVYGYGRTHGVYGQGFDSYAYGVYGSGQYGLRGESTPSSGSGYGVYATAYPSSGYGYAVYGSASPTAGGSGYGGTFYGYAPTGYSAYGVYARSYPTSGTGYGGYFYSSPTSGSGYGIRAYGYTNDSYGYGVYATGDSYGVIGVGSDYYDFYAAGAGTNYGPFTGGHEVKFADFFPQDTRPGTIVSVTGETKNRTLEDGTVSLSSTLPTVQLSHVANDKAVFGVFVSETPLPEEHWYEEKDGERFGTVNALGEGRVLVSNINGKIEAGDYITTSSIPGYGQRQDDDLLHSYTLGKAIETVDWDSELETVEHDGKTYKIYLIAVVYKSG
jgi:hypothetical protein